MKTTLFTTLFAASIVAAIPLQAVSSSSIESRQNGCVNSATDRGCWGEYSIDTDTYLTIPSTGVTREYWLSAEKAYLSPDGVEIEALTFNGTLPGPTITADWGDNLVIHVTNNLPDNGTTIHWHGMRQLGTSEADGVPGVTQCPIAPGETYTYRFHASQHGTTWYHSHFTLQYGDGMLGPLIINGPATANYDVDLGPVMLSDWSHESVFTLWYTAQQGAPPTLENGIINGLNTFGDLGKKTEFVFEQGKTYRMRLINSAIDGHFQFSIDGHSFQVIAADLVPIVPYNATSISISIGQRYDIIVEANATTTETTDFWMRAGWVTSCSDNDNSDDISAIIRYDNTSTADPTTTGETVGTNCGDEALASLVPHVSLDVGTFGDLNVADLFYEIGDSFTWTINSSSLLLDWAEPTNLRLLNGDDIWPTEYNVIPIDASATNNWAVFVIIDQTGFGITHPIHMHGHDFWVIGQSDETYDSDTVVFNLTNPPRRDVASLPGNGYLAIAFQIDNPGAWLLHCHIAWHASQGLALQFVESETSIVATFSDTAAIEETCDAWDEYVPVQAWAEDDSGI
ncbi:laccase precursor [Calycina marina]|uniref:laccase n=1 Tax=Calycina marina TaxID=1763456 RepID=A0A9P7YW00_9HELO|nr:laccase precursor [Calycina marina]